MMLAFTAASAGSASARVYNAAAASICRRHSAVSLGAASARLNSASARHTWTVAPVMLRAIAVAQSVAVLGTWAIAAARTNVAGIIARLP